MKERLQKFLARSGVASRRHAERLMSEGRVLVNNVPVRELGTKVDPDRDLVVCDGKLVAPGARKYFILYKPPGVVTTLSDPEGRPTVQSLLPGKIGRLFPVGRLDFDAEGALLMTDDGELAYALLHPRFQVPRIYLAKVKGMPRAEALDKLRVGVRLEDGPARADEVDLYARAEKNTWLKVVVKEGRRHLVKRMLAAVGHPVLRLFRPLHAGVGVSGLDPGQVRPLTKDEVRAVQAVARGEARPEPPFGLPRRRHGTGQNRQKD